MFCHSTIKVQTERLVSYARRKKRTFLRVPVWSDKTVLEMVFVESTSFIWPMYVALRLKPTTEWDCRAVPHDFKNVYNCTAYVVSPPQQLRAVNLLVSHSQDLYKSLKTLFVCFDGLIVK